MAGNQPAQGRTLETLLCGHDGELIFADRQNTYFSRTSIFDVFEVRNGIGSVRSRLGNLDMTKATVRLYSAF